MFINSVTMTAPYNHMLCSIVGGIDSSTHCICIVSVL